MEKNKKNLASRSPRKKTPPVKPTNDIPTNSDTDVPTPGENEPEKNDPRVEEPGQYDPTNIDEPPPNPYKPATTDNQIFLR